MCGPYSGLRKLQALLRTLQFLSGLLILALYSYFLAVLNAHRLDTPAFVPSVEIIAGASMLYVLIAVLISRCAPGLILISFLIMVCDLGFSCSFIYVATANSAGSGSCIGSVNVPLPSAALTSPAGVGTHPTTLSGMPSLQQECQMLSACLAVAIILIFLYLFSMMIELSIGRQRQRERRYGPGGKPPAEEAQYPSHSQPGFLGWFHNHGAQADHSDTLPPNVGPNDMVQIGTVTEFGSSGQADAFAEHPPQPPHEEYVEAEPYIPGQYAASVSPSSEHRISYGPENHPVSPLMASNRVDFGRNSVSPTLLPAGANIASMAAAPGRLQMPPHTYSNPNLILGYPPGSQSYLEHSSRPLNDHRPTSLPLLQTGSQAPVDPVHRTGAFQHQSPAQYPTVTYDRRSSAGPPLRHAPTSPPTDEYYASPPRRRPSAPALSHQPSPLRQDYAPIETPTPYPDEDVPDAVRIGHILFPGEDHSRHPASTNHYFPAANYNYD